MLSLHGVNATSGRWSAHIKPEHSAFYVEWALEGDGLYKGDRILEINGKLITCKSKDELQHIVGNSGKCQMVVLRQKAIPIPQKELNREKENNMRLQHRISYLEEQVKELQSIKEKNEIQNKQQQQKLQNGNTTSGHITSINITTPSTEKPLVYQRGNFITTLVGGKPIELTGDDAEHYLGRSSVTAHITKTLIRDQSPALNYLPRKSLSSSRISIGTTSHTPNCKLDNREREFEQARSVEHLNHLNGRHEISRSKGTHTLRDKLSNDARSAKSLNFEREKSSKSPNRAALEVHTLRPTPPKKPQRLSLQRAQSLQTVELNPAASDMERKRPLKRAHITGNNKSVTLENMSGSTGNIFTEKSQPLHTSSLGRQKHYI